MKLPVIPGYNNFQLVLQLKTFCFINALDSITCNPVLIKCSNDAEKNINESNDLLIEEFEKISLFYNEKYRDRCKKINIGDEVFLIYPEFKAILAENKINPLALNLLNCLNFALDLVQLLLNLQRAGYVYPITGKYNFLLNSSEGFPCLITQQEKCRSGGSTEFFLHESDPEEWPYLAPECFNEGFSVYTQQQNFYALGVLFFRLLTGKNIFKAESLKDWAFCHRTGEILDPSLFNPLIPSEIGNILAKLMNKNYQKRYKSLENLWGDFKYLKDNFLTGRRQTKFHPERHLLPERFMSPLYPSGREIDEARFKKACVKVKEGEFKAFFYQGVAGVGKTVLLELFMKNSPIQSYYIKFDKNSSCSTFFGVRKIFSQLQRRINSDKLLCEQFIKEISSSFPLDSSSLLSIVPELAEVVKLSEVTPFVEVRFKSKQILRRKLEIWWLLQKNF